MYYSATCPLSASYYGTAPERTTSSPQGQMKYETEFDWGGTRIYVTSAIVENLRVFFIEPKNGFFATPTVYGRYDDEVRFDFFCKAALEFLLKTGRQPDILHCHDWSTAHVAQSYWQVRPSNCTAGGT